MQKNPLLINREFSFVTYAAFIFFVVLLFLLFVPVKRLCNTDAIKREMTLNSNTIIINTAADFVAINFASGINPSNLTSKYELLTFQLV